MTPIVPMFRYPLKTLFVDDYVDVLAVYHHLSLPNKIATASNPKQALNELRDNAVKMPIFQDISDSYLTDGLQNSEEAVLSFTFNTIKSLIHDEQKYDKYGIVVTDYNMPEMDGLELCSKLSDLNIIKVLLTGEYQPHSAVRALNSKTIDYFLQKGAANSNEDLLASIRSLELRYFKGITREFLELTGDKFSFLADEAFAKIINGIIDDYKITEYYLLNSSGCFLLVNANTQLVLNIYTDEQLDKFCEMYAHIDAEVLCKIHQRELIPNFELSKRINLAQDFYTCTKVDGYYYNVSSLDEQDLLPTIDGV